MKDQFYRGDETLKCSCGGDLKRIAVDTYKCLNCGLKQAIGFLRMLDTYSPNFNQIGIQAIKPNIKTLNEQIIENIQKEIYKSLGANGNGF